MKRLVLVSICLFGITCSFSQVTVSPAFPRVDQPITITYDATQGTSGLVNALRVKIHTGVIVSGPTGTSWQHVVGNWGDPNSSGEMTSLGNDKWAITFTPRDYYASAGLPANASVYRLGMVFREAGPCGNFGGVSADCKKGAGTSGNGDIYVDLYQGGYALSVSSPLQFPLFVNAGSDITFTANTTDPSSIILKINGDVKSSVSGQTTLNYVHTVAEFGQVEVSIEATNGSETKTETLSYIVRSPVVNQARPSGIVPGINYSTDHTKVTLCILAPLKSSVYAFGDFTNWAIDNGYVMKKDGDYFWVEITGLIPNQEYAYQYLIDESMAVADPFADKFLDPNNDPYITEATYPDLKPYPSGATGIVSVLQTGQTSYVWQTTGYTAPPIEKLNVYELLVRDFDTPRTYQAVIDKLDYLENLGINAIELMPIMEFSGNDSWGYNPIFYFGVDKAYGTKNKLKELVDKAHAKGIAVILDMVLNQADYEFPYVKMYWQNGKPAPDNPWFNQDATHPFSVFFDFNHESQYTKNLVDTINHYWLTEFKFDGFRFDLSKGFTQTVNTDVGAWGNYDQSRVDILTRMANEIWSHHPDAYVILEHLGSDAEERVLANNGMTLWGIMTEAYKQNSMGYGSSSDISRTYYKNRTGSPWNNPASILGYMESHDEERMMFNNLQFGNSAVGYNVKLLKTALDREKAVFAFFLPIPGPKMIWQFGELGYDVSINENGRTGAKPIRWEYFENTDRKKLYATVSELFKLRNTYNVFHTSDIQISGGTDLYKQITLKGTPYNASPETAENMNVVIVGNFNVTTQTKSVNFPHTGNWYHYFSSGDLLTVTANPLDIQLQPGEFRIYTDVLLPSPEQELMSYLRPLAPDLISVQHTNKIVQLQWTDNSEIETGFRVFRKKSNESTFEELDQVETNIDTYTDRSLQPLTTYDYYVQAFNPVGFGNSGELSVTTSEDVITSIEECELDKVRVYPNPAKDFIKINLPENHLYDLIMLDSNGRIVNKLSIQHDQYDVAGLSGGVYFIRITGKKRVKYFRFVKM